MFNHIISGHYSFPTLKQIFLTFRYGHLVKKTIDVTTIGNAIVDTIASVDDVFLQDVGIEKGTMCLINDDQIKSFSSNIRSTINTSGGSAANTIVGFSILGGKGAYIGKVKADTAGKVFINNLDHLGIHYTTKPTISGPATAQCLVFVTPDAQRSMATYLGASTELKPEDIDPEIIISSQMVYLEGYLWDPPKAKDAFKKAISLAHDSGGKVALSLSDSFCVERYRDEFLDLVENQIDMLFANESEIMSLYQTNEFETAINSLPKTNLIAAITRGKQGSVILCNDDKWIIPSQNINTVLDTTGAGDLYAAGFLYAYTNKYDLDICGKLGGLVAAEIIKHFGARPQTDLKLLSDAFLKSA